MINLDSYILNDFFETLNLKQINYCVMNNYDDMPEIIPSDVDFAVDLKTYHQLDSLVEKLAEKHNVSITQKIWHGYHKCAYILSPLNIENYFWLQLDFFVDFSGKGFPNLFPSSNMLSGKRKYKNFYIPGIEIEAPFLLQRRIFKRDMKERHIATLKKLYDADVEKVESGVVQVFGQKQGASLIKMIKNQDIRLFNDQFSAYRKQLRKISTSNTDIVYRIKYVYWQLIRAIYRLYYPTGLSIAFIGRDTDAKRDFIDAFDQKISGSFHGTVNILPKKISDYIGGMIIKDYWSKVTKRKVLWNLDTSVKNWEAVFSSRLCFFKPDVVINIYDGLEDVMQNKECKHFILNQDKSQNEEILKECIHKALSIQAARTNRHLMNPFSPTAR